MLLLERIKKGESGAWEELYRRFHDDLLFTIRAHLGVRLRGFLESEDVLQSVALEAFRRLPGLEARREGRLRAYLHRIVLSKIRDRADYFGAQKRANAVPLSSQLEKGLEAETGPAYFEPGRYEKLEQTLERLPHEMREVILLHKLDGLPTKEVAEKIGKSDAATRKLYSRGLSRLTILMTAGC